MPNVNYAAQYGRELANAYPYLSYYGDLWNQGESTRFRPLRGKTVYIPNMSTTGARAVNRDRIDGVFTRNFGVDWEAHDLQMDRDWDTLVDPMDIDETNEVATIANITKTFNQFQKIPEQDAYMSSKLAGFAGAFGGVSTSSLTSATILSLWDDAIAFMTDQRVNRDRVRCKMTPNTYKLLKQAAGITRFIDLSGGIRGADRNIARLDGVTIEEIPSDMMKTLYSFVTGWTIDASAAQIDFLLYDPMAIAAPIVYDTSMMSAPTAQSKGKYLYYERYYYDVFILAQRQAGVYAHLSAAPSAGELTVKSVANAATGATAGDSIITVAGPGIFSSGAMQEGLKLVYCADENAAVSCTYGAVPPIAKTWHDLDANPKLIAGLTGSKVITVAEVNKETGFVVASGYATQVVTA